MNIASKPTFENPIVSSNPHNADVKEIKISIRNGHEITEYTFKYKAAAGVSDDQLRQQIKDTQHVFHQRIASLIELSKAIKETEQLPPEIAGANLLQKADGEVRLVTPLGSSTPPKHIPAEGLTLDVFKQKLEESESPLAWKLLAKKIDTLFSAQFTGKLQLVSQTTTQAPPQHAPVQQQQTQQQPVQTQQQPTLTQQQPVQTQQQPVQTQQQPVQTQQQPVQTQQQPTLTQQQPTLTQQQPVQTQQQSTQPPPLPPKPQLQPQQPPPLPPKPQLQPLSTPSVLQQQGHETPPLFLPGQTPEDTSPRMQQAEGRNPFGSPQPTASLPSTPPTISVASPESTAPRPLPATPLVHDSTQKALCRLGNSCYINSAMQIIAHFEPLYKIVSTDEHAKLILDQIRNNQTISRDQFIKFIESYNSRIHNNTDNLIDLTMGASQGVNRGGDVLAFLDTLLSCMLPDAKQDAKMNISNLNDILYKHRVSIPNLGDSLNIQANKPPPQAVLVRPIENTPLTEVKPKMQINGQNYRLEVVVMREPARDHTFPYVRNENNQLVPLNDLTNERNKAPLRTDNNQTINNQIGSDIVPFICIYVKDEPLPQSISPLSSPLSSSPPSSPPPPVPSAASTPLTFPPPPSYPPPPLPPGFTAPSSPTLPATPATPASPEGGNVMEQIRNARGKPLKKVGTPPSPPPPKKSSGHLLHPSNQKIDDFLKRAQAKEETQDKTNEEDWDE